MTVSRGIKPRRTPGDPVVGGRFTVEQRVRMSALALRILPMRNTTIRTGVVVGASLDDRYVRVHRDGVTTIESYHPDFWEAWNGETQTG